MTSTTIYNPKYENSWALVIGINAYPIYPLDFAVNDANAMAEVLNKAFKFPVENITVLLDAEATKQKIMQTFLKYAHNPELGADDRIIVFFAGHGFTKPGNRGEVGYLFPIDGNTADLNTLIRWDELTRNAELIPAKHILFVMDACYGGLAITRFLPPGSMRFMRDMLQRFTRQVLTAGKADETVSDGGGPRAGHSIFTGHLLNALEGAAASADGIVTANNVMAYVYDRVAKDHHSRQTPHYGFIEGDGDFIFNVPAEEKSVEGKVGDDTLIAVPASFAEQTENKHEVATLDLVKEYLTEEKYKIKLDGLMASKIREILEKVGSDDFPVNISLDGTSCLERLKQYEEIVTEMQAIVALIGKWGKPDQLHLIERVFSRTTDNIDSPGGYAGLLGLRWYPVLLLMFSAGIAALQVKNYQNLHSILTAPVTHGVNKNNTDPVIVPTVDRILDAESANVFKLIPGHERNYAPRSEYLFKVLQPVLEDLLFLGGSYEHLFDQMEIFYALVYADMNQSERGSDVWGPPGRFAWKFSRSRGGDNPFSVALAQADQQKDKWAPLQAGFFRGSYERFKEIADGYAELLKHLRWF